MLRKHSTLRRLFKECFRTSAFTVAVASAVLLVGTGAWAQSSRKKPPENPVLFQGAVSVPVDAANTTGGMFSFDISFVDQTTQTYYLADRSNQAVDVVDAKGDTFITQISASPPFAGVNANAEFAGPNGVLTANGCIIATDATNRVVSLLLAVPKSLMFTSPAIRGVRMSWHLIPKTTCCWSSPLSLAARHPRLRPPAP